MPLLKSLSEVTYHHMAAAKQMGLAGAASMQSRLGTAMKGNCKNEGEFVN